MINYINGNIFKHRSWDVMCHCANLYHTWGSGIVLPLKHYCPEAYIADCKTIHGSITKLGTFSFADSTKGKRVYNLYAQTGIGNDGSPCNRNCKYDHLYDALFKTCNHITLTRGENTITNLALPQIGCGLAGGSWIVVRAIINDIADKFKNINFTVYYL